MQPSRRSAGAAEALVQALVAAAVPVLLLTLNVHLAATPWALRLEYARPGFPSPVEMSAADRQVLAEQAAAFVVGVGSAELSVDAVHDGRALFSDHEIEHLVDVRRLVASLRWLAFVSAGVLVLAWARWRGPALPRLGRALEWGGATTVVAVVLVVLLVAGAWRTFFVGFHQLFFDPGTWQFEESSGLIRLFPEKLWFDTAVALATMCLLEGAAVALLGRRLRRMDLSGTG